jgi:site-specific recombinase XerD
MDYLCDHNAINENPVSGVRRPSEGSNISKTPTLSADQARLLLGAPDPDTLKGKRDRAILACLLYHALGRAELCGLRVKDYASRQGVPQLSVLGKGSKTRFIPIAPAAVGLFEAY